VIIESPWKSVKYEDVYLHAYETVGYAKQSLGRYFGFYRFCRQHSTLDRKAPDKVY
jgi:putative transposase